MNRRILPCLPLLFSVACASAGDLQALVVERAAFDLQCPATALAVTNLPGSTYGVEGCDQRATYVLSGPGCDHPRGLGRREAARYCTPLFDHGSHPTATANDSTNAVSDEAYEEPRGEREPSPPVEATPPPVEDTASPGNAPAETAAPPPVTGAPDPAPSSP